MARLRSCSHATVQVFFSGLMNTIAIISQKGGAGKTTVALHLAVSSTRAGRNTAIIDLDPQASAASWRDRREAALPVVLSAHASRLTPEIARVRQTEGDMLYLDTAPHDNDATLKVADAADLVLIPCRTAIMDLEAIQSTLRLVRTTGTPTFVVLNAVAPAGHDADHAAVTLTDLAIEVCPVRLGQRVALARALITGQAAQEIEPNGKAATEIEQLHDFITAHLQLCKVTA